MDPALDPAIFVLDLKNASKPFFPSFSAYYLLKVLLDPGGPKRYGSTTLMPREKRVVEISRTVIFLNKFDHEHGEKYLDYNSREAKVKKS